jgi:hypothetical protein
MDHSDTISHITVELSAIDRASSSRDHSSGDLASFDSQPIDLNDIKITPRDQQVLNLLVEGCSNKEIAGQLAISPRTVKQHLRTLFLRAGIREGRKRVKLAIAVYERPKAALPDAGKEEPNNERPKTMPGAVPVKTERAKPVVAPAVMAIKAKSGQEARR